MVITSHASHCACPVSIKLLKNVKNQKEGEKVKLKEEDCAISEGGEAAEGFAEGFANDCSTDCINARGGNWIND